MNDDERPSLYSPQIKIIGSFFSGERGKLSFNNDLDLSEIKRMYVIENSDLDSDDIIYMN